MKANSNSKIFSEGKTYDNNKLYTFRECDYRELWVNLDIVVKKLAPNSGIKNITENSERQGFNFEDQPLDSNGLDPSMIKLTITSRQNDDSSLPLQQDILPEYVNGMLRQASSN